MLETLKILSGFAGGLLFYRYLLDKATVKNYIKRLKQKKGADNVMTVSNGEKPTGVISGDMSRREVISIWKQLKD